MNHTVALARKIGAEVRPVVCREYSRGAHDSVLKLKALDPCLRRTLSSRAMLATWGGV